MSVLIPGSETYKTEEVNICVSQKIINGSIIIENGIITGLRDPIENSDIATKNYFTNIYNFVETNTATDISIQSDTTYTASEILGSIINRNTNGNTRFDSFPTSFQIITELGIYGTPSTTFNFVIRNTSSSDLSELIILNTQDIIIVGISESIKIYPESVAMFNCVINSDLTISAYYSSNLYNNISECIISTNKGPLIESNIRTYQFLPQYINMYNNLSFSNNIPNISNCIFNVLGDYFYESTGTYSGEGLLPTGIEMTEELGFTTNTITRGSTFNFVIKLSAFLPYLPSLYSFEILSPDASITLDPDSIFLIEFSELQWKYVSYSAICDDNGNPSFTVYCTGFYDTYTANI